MHGQGGVKNLTDLSQENGIEQFVLVSSLGVGGSGLTGWFLSFLLGEALDWKFKGEEHLRASGVPCNARMCQKDTAWRTGCRADFVSGLRSGRGRSRPIGRAGKRAEIL